MDSAAALLALPILVIEGQRALRVRAVVAAEIRDSSTTLRFCSRYRVHRDCLSIYLSFDGHILSSEFIELHFISLQGVDLPFC